MKNDILDGAKALDMKLRHESETVTHSSAMRIAAQLVAEEEQKRLDAERLLAEEKAMRVAAEAAAEKERNARLVVETKANQEHQGRLNAEAKLTASLIISDNMKYSDKSTNERIIAAELGRASAEERARLLEDNRSQAVTIIPDNKGIIGEMMTRLTPYLSRPKRGAWDFEIIHGDVPEMEGKRIVRVIARPRT